MKRLFTLLIALLAPAIGAAQPYGLTPPYSGQTISNTCGVASNCGALIASLATGSGTITPLTNNAYDLGTSSKAWRNIYAGTQILSGDALSTTVTGNGQIVARRNAANATIRAQTFGTSVNSYFACDRARGTAAAPTTLSSGDTLCSMVGVGFDGVDAATFYHGPEILMSTTETWSGTAHGSAMKFMGVLNGTTTQVPLIWANLGGLGDVYIPNGNLILNTTGKTLQIDSGTAASACKGTLTANGATPVVTSTTCALTGSIPLLQKTAASSAANGTCTVTAISNATSFTTECLANDTGTYSWVIIKEG